jgi:hypothetical protein
VSRRTEFVSYRPKTILNKGKRADHWFWSRYSAYPYKGFMHGCEFCYRLPSVQIGASVPRGCLGHRGCPSGPGLIYRSMGRKGLESIESVGPSMAKVIEGLLSPRR